MSKTILLTGATGFLGSHILKRLIISDYNVIILTRETSNKERLKKVSSFSEFVVNKDYSNFDDLFTLFSIDIIIHVATEYGRDFKFSSIIETNLLMPLRLIEASDKKKLSLFINTDTFSGKFPESNYLKQYVTSKNILNDYLKLVLSFKVINLRLEHVYGEFDSKNKFFTYVFNHIISNTKSIKLTEGSQKRDFVYVYDVVEAYLTVLKKQNELDQYTEFEVGTGSSISVKDFVYIIHEITRSESKLLFGALESRPDEIKDSKANNLSLLKLGWVPKFTPDIAIKSIIKKESRKYI